MSEERQYFSFFERGAFAAVVEVPTSGFAWRDDVRPFVGGRVRWSKRGANAGPWLVGQGDRAKRVPVLRTPDLLRQVDRLASDPSPPAIKRFADKFGWLKTPAMLVPLALRAKTPLATHDGDVVLGEHLGEWRAELRLFRDLREMWRAVRTIENAESVGPSAIRESRELLTRRLRKSATEKTIRYISQDEPFLVQKTLLHPALPEYDNVARFVLSGWPVAAGRYYVSLAVNDMLRGHINPAIMPLRGNALRLFTDRLLTAVYMAFALELAGALPERPCTYCGALFPATRVDRLHCSRRCKEAHRKRNRRDALRRTTRGSPAQ